MAVKLKDRTESTVRLYYARSRQPEIKTILPQKAESVEEAVSDYQKTLLPDSTSFGRTIYFNDEYIGDIWCYCIDKAETPNAMLSYCIFEKTYWNRGIASEAVALFLKEVLNKYGIRTIGAFTFSVNLASQRVLEKNGFQFVEEFEEDGTMSKYYRKSL